MGQSTVNARMAFGALLLLGVADLGLVNFSLAPRLAEEQAKQADGRRPEGTSSAQPTAPRPSAVSTTPSVAVAPPPVPTPAEPMAPAPTASASASTEPTTTAPTVVASAAPEVPPTPTAARPEPAPEPVASADKSGSLPDIQFELDTALLPASARPTLDDVIQKMKANTSLRLHVRGHSDQLGSHEHNVELSRRRAAAVVAYLLTHGVPNSRISTEAVGGMRPADSSNTPTAWARNRRVEIEWR